MTGLNNQMGIGRKLPHVRFAFLLVFLSFLAGTAHGTPPKLLSVKDQKEYQAAFLAADKKKWQAAFRHAGRTTEKLPLKALQFQYYLDRGTQASFEEITSFIDANPNWPLLTSLQRNAEQQITEKTPRKLLLGWFTNNPPVSARGMLHYANALIQIGRQQDAKALIRTSWVKMDLTTTDEKTLRARHRKWISAEDNLARLERLLWEGKTRAALRQARLVSKDYRALAEARVTLRRMGYGVDRAVNRVPAKLKNHPGLVYERLRWRVRKDRYPDAIDLVLNSRADESAYPHLWWRQRSILARWALKEGRISQAYRLAAGHAAKGGYAFADAEWTAGWIALRFLRDPSMALGHFKRMHAAVSYPVSLSRGAYWTGLAYESMNNKHEARLWFEKAAAYPTRFYGQMAANHLPSSLRPVLPAEYRPGAAEVSAFNKSEIVRLIRMLDQAKAEDQTKRMIRHLAQTVEDEGSFVLIARLSHDLDRPDLGVYTARKANQKLFALTETGFPTLSLKSGNILDQAVTLAIIRQESAFDVAARSSAGARGLMQLMPATAKQVARQNKLKYSRDRLTVDGAYNVTLGQSYLAGLIDRFDGSLPMAFAGYNAGPHRVKRWLRDYGDPRNSADEALDWIEFIPYEETRNYVQRVLENVVVYRQREQGRHVALNWELINSLQPYPSN
ncbi:lytic transglycosylase domain-containing protein [Aestuariispira insulae]|uniref:lytic transglycosylase domain-containing protein n=1 Tax=Aestuariispira insulae TaxID=1461337 RepID=UPI0015F27310|nr:lytic transglycosylase domain-containing protein [Aestuariispira insulae]